MNDYDEQNVALKEYVAPVIIEERGMLFTKEVWENFSEGNWCFGCTNCNCN
jgi:hypothetical protein